MARPAIVVDRAHRRIAPGGLVVGAQQERRVEQVVPVGEDVGGHHQLIADDALDRVAPAVQLRRDALDHDAAPAADLVGLGLSASRAARESTSVATARRTLSFVVVMAGPTLPDPARVRRDAPMSATMPRRCCARVGSRSSSPRSCWLPAGRHPPRSPSPRTPAPACRARRRRSASSTPGASVAPPASTPTAADPPPIGPRAGRGRPREPDRHRGRAGRMAARQRAARPGRWPSIPSAGSATGRSTS